MRIKFIFIIPLLMTFTVVCAQNGLKTIDKTVNFGMRSAEKRTIVAIIVHSTYNNSGGDKYNIDSIIRQFSHYNVSSHYVIGREGNIYQLVNEKNISSQAGKSSLPDGRTAVNSCSIGIELITSKDSLDAPTEPQISTLVKLVKDIKTRYYIKYILRHSDIAPGRKTDPWNMNWDEFLNKLRN